jgi:hypothetical protein
MVTKLLLREWKSGRGECSGSCGRGILGDCQNEGQDKRKIAHEATPANKKKRRRQPFTTRPQFLSGSHKIISKSATIPAILWFPEAAIRHLKDLFD